MTKQKKAAQDAAVRERFSIHPFRTRVTERRNLHAIGTEILHEQALKGSRCAQSGVGYLRSVGCLVGVKRSASDANGRRRTVAGTGLEQSGQEHQGGNESNSNDDVTMDVGVPNVDEGSVGGTPAIESRAAAPVTLRAVAPSVVEPNAVAPPVSRSGPLSAANNVVETSVAAPLSAVNNVATAPPVSRSAPLSAANNVAAASVAESEDEQGEDGDAASVPDVVQVQGSGGDSNYFAELCGSDDDELEAVEEVPVTSIPARQRRLRVQLQPKILELMREVRGCVNTGIQHLL